MKIPRITGVSQAIPASAEGDIFFFLLTENMEPFVFIANDQIATQIVDELRRAIGLLKMATTGSAVPFPDQESSAGWYRNTVMLSLMTMCLQDFAGRIIRHVLRGGALDDAGFAAIKEAGVRYLKNINAEGLTIDQEAEAVGQTINNFKQIADAIITQGRNLEQD
jgi:hypothetical protein